MLVRLYNSDGSIQEHDLAISYFPFAIYWHGGFYLHLVNGYYSPCPYLMIPLEPIERES